MSKASQIEIWVIRAKLYRNTRCLGKMSPYVNTQVGKKVLKSAVASKSGFDPAWSDVFTCSIPDDNNIELTVMDQGFFRNYVIGKGIVELSEILDQGRIDRDIRLYHKGKEAGFIRVVISCINDHVQAPQTTISQVIELENNQLDQSLNVLQKDNDEFKLIDEVISTHSQDSDQTNSPTTYRVKGGEDHLNGKYQNDNLNNYVGTVEWNEKNYATEEGQECLENFGIDSTYSTLPMVPDPAEVC